MSGNSSDAAGGGILNDGGTMSILTSTISGNAVIAGATSAFGGGISNAPDTNGDTATLKMVNDTLAGNRAGGGATAGFGGGLDNEAQASATLTNVTVSHNRAGTTGTGGGLYNNGQAALRGTILAGNTAANAQSNCGLPVALTSNGYNLSSDSTCGLTGIGDQTAVNPAAGGARQQRRAHPDHGAQGRQPRHRRRPVLPATQDRPARRQAPRPLRRRRLRARPRRASVGSVTIGNTASA